MGGSSPTIQDGLPYGKEKSATEPEAKVDGRNIPRRRNYLQQKDVKKVIDETYPYFKALVISDDIYASFDEITATAINSLNDIIRQNRLEGVVRVDGELTRVVSIISSSSLWCS